MSGARWDVFFSYARSDAALASPLLSALESCGLRVFVDDRGVREFASISDSLSEALAESTVLLAFYSKEYPARSSCNFELTAAFVAGQSEGDPCRRIVVVSTVPSFDHVHPIELRDRRSVSLRDYAGRELDLARLIARRVDDVEGVIGVPPQPSGTPWYPFPPPVASPGPQPFRRQLWDTHSALRPAAAPYHTGRWEGGVARVCSLDRATATAFAQDYALQFSGAYPGGVHWLSPGTGNTEGDTGELYVDSLRALCAATGLPWNGPAEGMVRLAERLADEDRPTLWVIDGFPESHEPRLSRLLRNPQPGGSTLITESGAVGTPGAIDITEADGGAAREVLAAGSAPPPSSPGQGYAATEIVRLLGGHPVALAAARRLLPVTRLPERAYREVHRGLRDPDHDVLDFDRAYRELLDRLAAWFEDHGEDERACMVWAGDVGDFTVSGEEAAARLAALDGTDRATARRRVGRALATASDSSYVSVSEGRVRVHPLLARAVRYGSAGSRERQRLRGTGRGRW